METNKTIFSLNLQMKALMLRYSMNYYPRFYYSTTEHGSNIFPPWHVEETVLPKSANLTPPEIVMCDSFLIGSEGINTSSLDDSSTTDDVPSRYEVAVLHFFMVPDFYFSHRVSISTYFSIRHTYKLRVFSTLTSRVFFPFVLGKLNS